MKNSRVIFLFVLWNVVSAVDMAFAMNPRKRGGEEFGDDPVAKRLRLDESSSDEEENEMDVELTREEEIQKTAQMYRNWSQEDKNKELLESASTGILLRVEALLLLGADPNWRGPNGQTALWSAMTQCEREIVERLLQEEGINIDPVIESGEDKGATPLWGAIDNGCFDIVPLLIEKGANVNAVLSSEKRMGQMPLWIAIETLDINLAEMLLKAGARSDVVINNVFPLLWLISSNASEQEEEQYPKYEAMAKLLIRYGANVNQALGTDSGESAGMTALYDAVQTESLSFVQLLLDHGARLESVLTSKESAGETPLYAAVDFKNVEMVRFLLERGASMLVAPSGTQLEETLLYLAAKRVEEEAKKAEVEEEEGDVRARTILNLLLAEFAKNPNKQDARGNTELHYLADLDKDDIAIDLIRTLLSHGANPSLKNKIGKTALDIATEIGNEKARILFLEKVNKVDEALVIATKEGFLVDALRLLRKGADPNTQEHSKTVLILAVTHNAAVAIPIITALIARGADVNKKDQEGKTALVYAAEQGKDQAFRVLLTRGARPEDVPASISLTPAMCAALQAQTATTEEQPEERVIDMVTQEDITDVPEDQKIMIAGNTYLKRTLMDRILSEIATKDFNKISDPLRNLLGKRVIESLAHHFSIPARELQEPALSVPLQKIPEGLDEEQFLLMKEHQPDDALAKYRRMIASDSIRALSRRLQPKEDNLQMYPEGSSYWDDEAGGRVFLEQEADILRQAIKDRLRSFGYEQ